MSSEVDRVREVLAVTRVMTAGQAARLAGVEALSPSGLVRLSVGVNLRHQQKGSRCQVPMVAVRDLRGRVRGSDLLHMCGALELLMGAVPLGQFDPAALARPSRRPEGETPDLTYRLPTGESISAEFDTGAYKLAAMHGKLARFTREYDAVVYGTTVPGRFRNLTQDVREGLRLGSGRLSIVHVAALE